MADKGGLQLLPETRKSIQVKVPGENRLIAIGSALIAVVLVLYGGLLWYGQNLKTQIAAADTQLASLDKSRNKTAEQSLLTLSSQIGVTQGLIQNHIYWSTGLSQIEAAVEPNVQFESFAGTTANDTFTIRAIADNYSTIAHQLSAFVADDAITDITLDNVSALTNGSLDFDAKITFDPTKFLTVASQIPVASQSQ